MAPDGVWMTPAALERLQQELADLTAVGREVTDLERARVVELKELIQRAEAVSKPDDGLVEPGMRITVRFDDDGSTSSFVLGDRTLLGLDDSLDIDVFSPDSPLGSAIDGLHVGDVAQFESPRGKRSLTILAATPAT